MIGPLILTNEKKKIDDLKNKDEPTACIQFASHPLCGIFFNSEVLGTKDVDSYQPWVGERASGHPDLVHSNNFVGLQHGVLSHLHSRHQGRYVPQWQSVNLCVYINPGIRGRTVMVWYVTVTY